MGDSTHKAKQGQTTYRVFLAWLLCALAWPVLAGNGVLSLSPDLYREQLAPYLSELEDPQGILTIQDILQRERDFRPVAAYVEHGFSPSIWWFRFTVKNVSPAEMRAVIETNVGYFYDVQAFGVKDGEVIRHEYAGLSRPYTSRLLQEPHISMPLVVPAHESYTWYIRLDSRGHVIFPATISNYEGHVNHLLRDRMYDNLFYGLAIGIILYNFFLFLTTRQKAFGFYAVHLVFAIMTLSSSDEGSLFEFWPAFLDGYQYLSIFIWTQLAMVFLLMFTTEFMGLEKNAPRLAVINKALVGFGFAYILLIPILPIGFVTVASMLLSLAMVLLAIGESAWAWTQRVSNAALYLAASFILVFFVFLVIICSPVFGVFNNTTLAHYGLNIGFSLQMIILSVGLGRQINELREKEIETNTELLKARLKEVSAHMEVNEARAESEAKGRFLAAMSHEIRTPMNGVLGMTELLSGTHLDKEQKRYVEAILGSGKALLNILNDVLDYSKMEAGKIALESIPFDLHRLAHDAMEIFSAQKRKQVEAVLDIDPDVPVVVCGDPTRLRQVFMNLLSNAFKFTESGQVSLRIRAMERNEHSIDMCVVVSDTGVGISPAGQKHLFQSFTQADSSTTRRFGGTGLGLSISRTLVELMQGQIDLASTEGQGTRVTVRLRLALPDEAMLAGLRGDSHGQASEAMQPLPGLSVLVAEDNPVNCMVVEGLLRRIGANMVVVPHGQAALEAYRESPTAFDVVLMDCEMPVMDGYAAVEAMRILEEENGWRRMPVIALSAHLGQEVPAHAGFDAFLQKPVSLKQLHAALRPYWQSHAQP